MVQAATKLGPGERRADLCPAGLQVGLPHHGYRPTVQPRQPLDALCDQPARLDDAPDQAETAA